MTSGRVAGLSPRTRARLAYVAFYCAVGGAAPYLVLYYQRIGLTLAEIGLVVSVGSIVSLLAAPAWGLLSDRRRGSPAVLAAAAATATAGVVAMFAAHDLAAVLACSVPLSAGFAGVGPIIDARVLEISGPERSGFGPLRAWGSASYIVAAFGTGAAIDVTGIGAAFAITAASLGITAIVGSSLARSPRGAPLDSGASGPIGLEPGPILAAPRFGTRGALRVLLLGPLGLFLGGAWLTYTGLAGVMAFYTLRYAELAAPAVVIGLSSAIGAAVEVPIMLAFPRLAARYGAQRLVVAGAAVFTVRAFVAAVTADPVSLLVLAGIGGAGYACFTIGGITHVSRHAPASLAATAQGMFSGLANGLGQVVAGAGGGVIAAAIGITGLFGVSGALGLVAAAILGLGVRDRGRERVSVASESL